MVADLLREHVWALLMGDMEELSVNCQFNSGGVV